MKNFRRIACALFCILMLTGCNNTEKYPWKLTEADSVYQNTSEDVSMEVYQDMLSTKDGWFLIKNRGEYDAVFDSSYYLLVRKNGTWYHMDADVAVLTQYETRVKAHCGDYRLFFDWYSVYGELPNGTYRLVATYQLDGEDVIRPAFYTFKIGLLTPEEKHYEMYDRPPTIYVNDTLYRATDKVRETLDIQSLTQIGVIERYVLGCNTPTENFHSNHWDVGTPIYQWNDIILVYDGTTFWKYEAEETDAPQ